MNDTILRRTIFCQECSAIIYRMKTDKFYPNMRYNLSKESMLLRGITEEDQLYV